MISNNILAKEQYGFRSNTSTEKAIYQLINNILKALGNKYLVGGIFCDLTKVFVCVDHDILLGKLEYYGIKGIANNLIKSYLKDRQQRVVIRNKSSISLQSNLVLHGHLPEFTLKIFLITFSTSSSVTSFLIMYFRDVSLGITSCRARLKRDGTRAETRFGLLAKWTSPFKLSGGQFSQLLAVEVWASPVVMVVMLDTPYSGVECKTTSYPLHSHVSPSLPLPCVTVCHQVSTEPYMWS